MKLIKLFRHYRNTYPQLSKHGQQHKKDWILKEEPRWEASSPFQAYPYAVVRPKNTLWI